MQTQRSPRVLTSLTLAVGILLSLASPALSLRGAHYLSAVQGDVYIRRVLRFLPQRASSGDLVKTDQILRVDPNSQVTLVCSNHTSHRLSPGTHAVSDYCPAPPPASETPRNLTREVFDGNQPYLLSPRNTALLSPENFLIQWHQNSDGDDTELTEITVQGRDVNWTIETSLNQIPYDGPQTFRADFSYTVTVERGEKSSSAQFSVLPEFERDRVNQAVAAIQALDLEPDAAAIGLALVYLNYQHGDPDRHSNSLNLEALQVLQERIQAGTRNSQLYLLQAEAYLAMDLPLEARQGFRQTLELAEANNEQERLADSYRRLGEIAARQTEDETAREFLQNALALYEELGDQEQVENAQEQLASLGQDKGFSSQTN